MGLIRILCGIDYKYYKYYKYSFKIYLCTKLSAYCLVDKINSNFIGKCCTLFDFFLQKKKFGFDHIEP